MLSVAAPQDPYHQQPYHLPGRRGSHASIHNVHNVHSYPSYPSYPSIQFRNPFQPTNVAYFNNVYSHNVINMCVTQTSSLSPAVSTASVASPVAPSAKTQKQDARVAQALEIARESEEGASEPTIKKILETAFAEIWGKLQAEPESYVMTSDEFSLFNYFQYGFKGNKLAVAAIQRYWNTPSA